MMRAAPTLSAWSKSKSPLVGLVTSLLEVLGAHPAAERRAASWGDGARRREFWNPAINAQNSSCMAPCQTPQSVPWRHRAHSLNLAQAPPKPPSSRLSAMTSSPCTSRTTMPISTAPPGAMLGLGARRLGW